jgi:hypothetical protein
VTRLQAAPLAPAAQSPMPAAQMGMYGAFNFAPVRAVRT